MKPTVLTLSSVVALAVLIGAPVLAQQITGELGSPTATTTIDGKQLPPPDPKFGGVIKERASESTPWWPPRIPEEEGRLIDHRQDRACDQVPVLAEMDRKDRLEVENVLGVVECCFETAR